MPHRISQRNPLLFIFLALLVLGVDSAAAIDFPALTGRVVDRAGLLNDVQTQILTERLARHETESSNQIVVVTLPSLQGETIESFALALGRHWGIGQADRNNGVLLLVAPNERKVRIDVGYGLEGDLPDALAKWIIDREVLPAFRNGQLDRGVMNGTHAILDAIEGSYVAAPRTKGSGSGMDRVLAGALIIVLILIGVHGVKAYRNRRRGNAAEPTYSAYGAIDGRNYDRSGYGSGSFGGGGYGGGGFSGGGGSFGGGGSSGSW